jgi:hypothetical protein
MPVEQRAKEGLTASPKWDVKHTNFPIKKALLFGGLFLCDMI